MFKCQFLRTAFSFTVLLIFSTLNGCGFYPPPILWESEILAFETQDQIDPPQENAIVVIGSSSINYWDTIEDDLSPLPIIARGFGGSTINGAVYYADRIVTVYNPKIVVIYEGDNDIFFQISPETLLETYIAFIKKVRNTLPDVPIYFISIKPSVSRWYLWQQCVTANTLIETYSSQNTLLNYIDVASSMLDAEGFVHEELFKIDGLHMNAQGYEVWTEIIRPILINDFY